MTGAEYDSGTYPFADYWMRFHSRKLSPAMSLKWWDAFSTRAVVFSHGYFEKLEYYRFVYAQLQAIALMFSRGPDDLSLINGVLKHESSLRPAIRSRNGRIEWSFAFSTLSDALLGLMVQRKVGGATFATCQPCGRIFTSGRKYCSDECMLKAQERKRRESPFLREKRRLRELLTTRVEKHGLSLDKANEIRQAVNTAPDSAALESVVEKYGAIFKRPSRSAESEAGRQEK